MFSAENLIEDFAWNVSNSFYFKWVKNMICFKLSIKYLCLFLVKFQTKFWTDTVAEFLAFFLNRSEAKMDN